MALRTLSHTHSPIYRVVRRNWTDPLDTSFSRAANNRWNPPDAFSVLYTACSEEVARAVVQDIFAVMGAGIADLTDEALPQLCEIDWAGSPVDVATPEGVSAAGFPSEYPDRVATTTTQAHAIEWNRNGLDGVVCRSASMWRLGLSNWLGDHESWSELAIFTENATQSPSLVSRRDDLEWLLPDDLP